MRTNQGSRRPYAEKEEIVEFLIRVLVNQPYLSNRQLYAMGHKWAIMRGKTFPNNSTYPERARNTLGVTASGRGSSKDRKLFVDWNKFCEHAERVGIKPVWTSGMLHAPTKVKLNGVPVGEPNTKEREEFLVDHQAKAELPKANVQSPDGNLKSLCDMVWELMEHNNISSMNFTPDGVQYEVLTVKRLTMEKASV